MKKFINIFILAFLLVGVANATCSISVNYPKNNLYTEDTTPDFNFTVTGTNGTYYCNILVEGTDSGHSQVTNDTTKVFTPSALDVKNHIWYINCTNGSVLCVSDSRYVDIGNMNNEGVNDMRKFIEDLAGVIIVMLPLTVVIIMLAVVFKFRDFFTGMFNKFIKR